MVSAKHSAQWGYPLCARLNSRLISTLAPHFHSHTLVRLSTLSNSPAPPIDTDYRIPNDITARCIDTTVLYYRGLLPPPRISFLARKPYMYTRVLLRNETKRRG